MKEINSIQSKVAQFITKENLISEGDTIGVAVSGGKDSVVMLHILQAIKKKNLLNTDFNLSIIHVNHQMRGNSSFRDEEFVSNLAKLSNLPFYCRRAEEKEPTNTSAYQSKDFSSYNEEWARKLRYGFFSELHESQKVTSVATAHKISDSVETFIFRAIRGSGLRGLVGIPVKRDFYIRPLLCLTSDEVNRYYQLASLNHVEDETNSKTDYSRNKIRHNIIPKLVEVNENAESNLIKTMGFIESAYEFMSSYCDKLVSTSEVCSTPSITRYNIESIKDEPEAILSLFVQKVVSKIDPECVTEELIQKITSDIKNISNYLLNDYDSHSENMVSAVLFSSEHKCVVTTKYLSIVRREKPEVHHAETFSRLNDTKSYHLYSGNYSRYVNDINAVLYGTATDGETENMPGAFSMEARLISRKDLMLQFLSHSQSRSLGYIENELTTPSVTSTPKFMANIIDVTTFKHYLENGYRFRVKADGDRYVKRIDELTYYIDNHNGKQYHFVSDKVGSVIKGYDIPYADKEFIPVLANDEGKVIWVYGRGFSMDVRKEVMDNILSDEVDRAKEFLEFSCVLA